MFESTVVLDALTLKMFLTHITIETEEENDFVKGRMAKGGTSFVWTSGRKCNFHGCHGVDLNLFKILGAYLGPCGVTPRAIAQFLQAFCTNLKDILLLLSGE